MFSFSAPEWLLGVEVFLNVQRKHVTSSCQQDVAPLGFTSYAHASFQCKKLKNKTEPKNRLLVM